MAVAMMESMQRLGAVTIASLVRTGRGAIFFAHALRGSAGLWRRPGLIVKQLYFLGVLSLPIIMVSGLFVGMVLGLQGYNTLIDFGAEESLGSVVALSLVRELGPVITALLYAGRAGSALTAEIGLMKVTEQLASMEFMAVDPHHRVVAPRLLAGIVAMPLLALIFTAIGILGGYLVGVGLLGVQQADGAEKETGDKVVHLLVHRTLRKVICGRSVRVTESDPPRIARR